MKRLMMLATLAASVTGCVANQGDAPVRFLGARALESQSGACGLADFQLAQGSLDVSGGGSYLLGVNVETNTGTRTIIINNEVFSGEGLSDVNLQEVVLTYQSQPVLALPEDRIPFYAVFRPGTTGDESFALMYAIGPNALKVLRDPAVLPVGAPPVTLLATVKAVGKFSGGMPVETNAITFPIIVRNSGYNPETNTCPVAGQSPVGYAGPCGQVGQDTGAICRVPPPASTTP